MESSPKVITLFQINVNSTRGAPGDMTTRTDRWISVPIYRSIVKWKKGKKHAEHWFYSTLFNRQPVAVEQKSYKMCSLTVQDVTSVV